MSAHEHPDVMNRLHAARPEIDDALLSPTSPTARALVEEIVTMEPNPTVSSAAVRSDAHPRRRRPRVLVASGAAAAAIAIAVAAIANTGHPNGSRAAANHPSSPTTAKVVPLVNIRTIAARSNDALGASGRAEIVFDSDGHQSGTTDLTFAGHDVEMSVHFNGQGGDPGLVARNMTVGGEFYLYTPGPDGVSRWYHQTNDTVGSVFNSDPRTLLATLAPEAGFVEVGTDTIDGVAVRHLRATSLAAVPSVDLSLGPIDARDMKALDLWVGADDVVRRLDLATEQKSQQLDPGTAPKLEKSVDGTVTIIDKDGHRTVLANPNDLNDALKAYPHVTVANDSHYSVRFSDIGAPITIAAPVGAVDIAAQG